MSAAKSAPTAEGGDDQRFQLLTVPEVEALPDLEWLVPGIIPRPSLAFLYGEPGCGKTFVALSLALTVASGGEWLGRQTVRAPVLYIAAEGVLGLKTRIAAHRQRHGLVEAEVRFIKSGFNALDDADVKALSAAIDGSEFEPGLIVVDTLARISAGADENSAKDMGRVIEVLDAMKTMFKAAVLVIHHTRKNGGAERGSSVLRGAADVMIQCEAGEGQGGEFGVNLECTKMKDAEPFPAFGAALLKVPLADGRSSLAIGGALDVLRSTDLANGDKIIGLLSMQFAEKGATHKELERAFVAAKFGSDSKFDRALRAIKDDPRLERIKGDNNRWRYFPVGVTGVSKVSDGK